METSIPSARKIRNGWTENLGNTKERDDEDEDEDEPVWPTWAEGRPLKGAGCRFIQQRTPVLEASQGVSQLPVTDNTKEPGSRIILSLRRGCLLFDYNYLGQS